MIVSNTKGSVWARQRDGVKPQNSSFSFSFTVRLIRPNVSGVTMFAWGGTALCGTPAARQRSSSGSPRVTAESISTLV
jgi:hypothetical protein